MRVFYCDKPLVGFPLFLQQAIEHPFRCIRPSCDDMKTSDRSYRHTEGGSSTRPAEFLKGRKCPAGYQKALYTMLLQDRVMKSDRMALRMTMKIENSCIGTDSFIAAKISVTMRTNRIQLKNKAGSEAFVGMTGFEPAASSSRTKRATGLRYIPRCGKNKTTSKPGYDMDHFQNRVVKLFHMSPI
jgi:hypothetical protein